MNALFFAFLPFLNLGYGEYLSFQCALSLIVLWKFRRHLTAAVTKDRNLKLAVVASFYLSLLGNPSEDFIHDVLQISREGLMFVLIVSIVQGAKGKNIERNLSSTEFFGLLMTIGISILLISQEIYLSRGIYFGLPKEWFIGDPGTLPDKYALLGQISGAGRALRPMGTFNEPSYCGFVLLSILLMFYRRMNSSIYCKTIVALCLADALLLQSMSYVLAIVVIGYFSYVRKVDPRTKFWVLGVGAVLVGVIVYSGGLYQVITRLSTITADYSTTVRIFLPLATLPIWILDHPLGFPGSSLEDALSQYLGPLGFLGGDILQNALLDFLFLFGLCGLPALYLLLRSGSDISVKLYLLFSGIFNGSILSFDKFAVMCFAVCVYESSKTQLALNSARRAAYPTAKRYATSH